MVVFGTTTVSEAGFFGPVSAAGAAKVSEAIKRSINAATNAFFMVPPWFELKSVFVIESKHHTYYLYI
jgi:hypothetical protein